MSTSAFIQIDEEGYFAVEGNRIEDKNWGLAALESLKLDDRFRLLITSPRDDSPQDIIVEAFDQPLVAKSVAHKEGSRGFCGFAYGFTAFFDFSSLKIDEWDRVLGLTDRGIPFVLSRHAQIQFFDLLDGFDDESVTINKVKYPTPPWLSTTAAVSQDEFWSHIYQTEDPGWDLGKETPILNDVLPQLKLTKSKILVLGCGSGNDAAYFAKQGHVVTGVDFSLEAITRAKSQYGHIENLKFTQADVFNLPESWNNQFDLVFEHTCFCAIDPGRRNELVKVWRRLLNPHGHLLGIFFVMPKLSGPPFGGSEWELRERLKNNFTSLFWTRWKRSIEKRQGTELVVYAKKHDRLG